MGWSEHKVITVFYLTVAHGSDQNTIITLYTQVQRKKRLQMRELLRPLALSVFEYSSISTKPPKLTPIEHVSRAAILQWRQICVLESQQRLWLLTDLISGFVSISHQIDQASTQGEPLLPCHSFGSYNLNILKLLPSPFARSSRPKPSLDCGFEP